MIVIKGKYKNRKLKAGQFKPTKSLLKEAVFNMISFENCSSFLDLFCGSGQMGIEALSRGYEKAVFVDKNIKSARDNLKFLNLPLDLAVKWDVIKYLKSSEENFDMIYADPPYDFDKDSEVITLSLNSLKQGGVFFYETSIKKLRILDLLINENKFTVKKYGVTLLLKKKL